ncbi:hypothetical protein CCP4SC76_1970001 [Gammaproteobacteria bacterium]
MISSRIRDSRFGESEWQDNKIMAESKFRVVLNGLISNGEKIEDVARHLAELFHVTQAIASNGYV